MAENIVSPKQVKSSLFDFGLCFDEPDLWSIIPDWTLRIYDQRYSYFACWDIGCPTNSLSNWPKPTNPKYHWNFNNIFVELDGCSMYVVKHE